MNWRISFMCDIWLIDVFQINFVPLCWLTTHRCRAKTFLFSCAYTQWSFSSPGDVPRGRMRPHPRGGESLERQSWIRIARSRTCHSTTELMRFTPSKPGVIFHLLLLGKPWTLKNGDPKICFQVKRTSPTTYFSSPTWCRDCWFCPEQSHSCCLGVS